VQEKVFTKGFNAIVMPTMLTPYVKADWFSSSETATVTINNKQVQSRMGFFTTWMWNLLGRYPVVNVPTGMTKENIPLGMQIIANTFDDLTAFQLANAYARSAPAFYIHVFPDL
jgi:amidase